MHRKRRLNIQDLNPHLICVLCGGYFIDATTIIECLHSFCRPCIVQHLEGSKYCPICDVQVHKTKPLQNIRQDPALQDIVYKLVPGLFQNEMRCRREFLSKHPDTVLPSSSTILVTDPPSIYTPDEKFNITLEYWKCSNSRDSHTSQERRYLRCPGAVSVSHLHKLIQAKFDLSPIHIIEFLYKDELLQDYLTLMDIAYIYKWKRKGPLNLSYRIIECSNKRIKLNDLNSIPQGTKDSLSYNNSSQSDNSKCDITSSIETSSDWKEVQLQISETGIMSVTGITLEDNNALSTNDVDNSAETDTNTSVGKKSEALIPLVNPSISSELETDCENDKKSAKQEPDSCKSQPMKREIETNEQQSVKQADSPQVQICQPECYNNSKQPLVCTDPVSVSNETTKEIMPKLKSVDLKAKVDVTRSGCSKEALNVATHNSKEHPREPLLVPKHQKPQTVKNSPVMVVAPIQNVKKTNSGSMGYKTLKVPPKTWNPSITRSSYLNSKNQASNSDSSVNDSNVNPSKSSEKAPRFFKMRNMPRYLGNPASGVKPMYQVASNSKVPNQTPTAKNKPIVMKIDPKTLSPIVSSNTSPGPQNKAFYSPSQGTTESPTSTSNVLSPKDQGKTGRFVCQPFPSTTGSSSTLISSTNVSHSSNFSLNTATLNMLASNPSFLPNATNFLYGNFPNFSPPLLGSGSNMVSGLGAYHSMPPSINMLFPHHRSSFPAHPPAVQRIPPSKNTSTSNVGHKLHHNSTPNSITSSLSKSPLQSNSVAKSNILNPKNGIDNKQIKKSTDATSLKPKNSQNDEVSPANQQNYKLELNTINNNNNDASSQNSIINKETNTKSSMELANVCGKDSNEAKALCITGEGTILETQPSTEHSRIVMKVFEYDKDEDHRKDKTCIKSPLMTECTTPVEEEKSSQAFCTPATLKTDKTCYSGQKPDIKSKDTIVPLHNKT